MEGLGCYLCHFARLECFLGLACHGVLVVPLPLPRRLIGPAQLIRHQPKLLLELLGVLGPHRSHTQQVLLTRLQVLLQDLDLMEGCTPHNPKYTALTHE